MYCKCAKKSISCGISRKNTTLINSIKTDNSNNSKFQFRCIFADILLKISTRGIKFTQVSNLFLTRAKQSLLLPIKVEAFLI